jgi:hypothetical protein
LASGLAIGSEICGTEGRREAWRSFEQIAAAHLCGDKTISPCT